MVKDESVFSDSNIYAKGGLARSILQEYLGLDPDPIRDLDFVLISNSQDSYCGNINYDSYSRSIKKYLKTRDFTINEVAYRPNCLIVSELCLRHTLDKILHNRSKYSCSRTISRASLFQARFGYKSYQVFNKTDDDFNIFVCLVKAIETNCVRDYISNVSVYGFFPGKNDIEILEVLMQRVEAGHFYIGRHCYYILCSIIKKDILCKYETKFLNNNTRMLIEE